jgi:hypothetical protein
MYHISEKGIKMNTANHLKEKLDLYRRWFSTLLIKEFMNLPFGEQSKFLAIAEKFMADCKRVHEEARDVKEKTVQFQVVRILPNDDYHMIIGEIEGTEVRVRFPSGTKIPNIGDKISCVLFSFDEEIWYSSKEELITGR